MIDQPTEQFTNEAKFIELLKTLDPELYFIKLALQETGVNPEIVRRIIRALGNMEIGTGYGVIEVLMKARTVTQIKTGESDIVNLPTRVEELS
jgi:hypothetical protein